MKTLFSLCMIALFSMALNVGGTYQTDFGELKLKQTNNTITGTYSYAGEGGQTAKGSIKGTLKGNVCTFTWQQQQGQAKAGGSGKFTFSKDGKNFKGTWKDSKGKSGEWNGKRG